MGKVMSYGYFPGGSYDPRDFEPDREVNTPTEIAAWEAACALRRAGVGTVERPSGSFLGNAICCGSAFGMGTYWIDEPDAPDGDGESVTPAGTAPPAAPASAAVEAAEAAVACRGARSR